MQDHSRRFAWRAMTSVVVGVAFLVLVTSGVFLCVSPPGRIANWTDWRIAGLTKHDWIDLHVWFGLLFLLASILHIVFNLRLLMSYFKNRLTRRIGLRREWVVALGLCGVVLVGTRVGVPPFSTFLSFNERIKNSWDDPRAAAPIPHAELLTLGQLAEQAAVPLSDAQQRLVKEGWGDIDPDTVIASLASEHHVSAQRVYEIVSGETKRGRGLGRGKGSGGMHGSAERSESEAEGHGGGGGGPGLGRSGGGGWGGGPGRMTLAEFCQERQVDLQEAQTRLTEKGITADPERTLRDIAQANGLERPYEVVEIILGPAR